MPRRLARFEDRHGRTLKGVVVAESGGDAALGFAYLPGIVLGATAVHGLGLKVADCLARAGFPTAIFDPPGVGESEGDYPAGTHEELTDWVTGGNLVESTLETVDWMRSHLGVERVALIGHCGGALTAAYSAAEHDAIAGALLISPPSLRRQEGKRDIDRPEVADEYFTLYVRRIFDPARWRRLLSGETDYRTLLTVVRSKAARVLRSKRAVAKGASNPEPDRFNQRLVESVRRCLEAGKSLSVVFGDRDVEVNNFRDFYAEHMDSRVPFVIIEDTSHGFTTAAGQERLFEEVRGFARRVGV